MVKIIIEPIKQKKLKTRWVISISWNFFLKSNQLHPQFQSNFYHKTRLIKNRALSKSKFLNRNSKIQNHFTGFPSVSIR